MIQIHLVSGENVDQYLKEDWQSNQAKRIDFSGKPNDILVLINPDGEIDSVLYGYEDAPHLRWNVAALCKKLPPGVYQFDAEALSPESVFQIHLAWHLEQYKFDRYLTQVKTKVLLENHPSVDQERLNAMVKSVTWARDLINTPAEDMGPEELAQQFIDLAQTFNVDVETVVGDALLDEGYPLVHAVGRASQRAPRVIRMSWGESDHPKLTLIGKGVCFDTGGLNLKPGVGMRRMKKDMAGAAHVIALANLVMTLDLPIQLELFVPIVDNNIGSKSYRPGDIFIARNGKSVEIDNTDAEGRLILADVLVAACESGSDLIIDFATLTGNRALGIVGSCFSRNVTMTRNIQDVGHGVHDPVWSMPLVEEYCDLYKGPISDLVNVVHTPVDCGTAVAAAFLDHFVDRQTDWIHCDILGQNNFALPGKPKGGDVFGIRAIFEFLEQHWNK